MEMLKFRFCTHIPVRTPLQIPPIIDWMRRHDQDAAAIVACGAYFDVAKPGLTQAADSFNRKWVLMPFAMAIVFFLATFAAGMGASLDRALLQFKATGNWFFLDENGARPLGDSPGFLFSKCGASSDVLAKESGFEPQEVSILCDAARTDDVVKFVRKVVGQQRIGFGAFALFLLGATLTFASAVGRVNAMLKLRQIVREKADAQPEAEASTG
ncbi:hypothetical protein GCM10027317_42630 [Massilia agri]